MSICLAAAGAPPISSLEAATVLGEDERILLQQVRLSDRSLCESFRWHTQVVDRINAVRKRGRPMESPAVVQRPARVQRTQMQAAVMVRAVKSIEDGSGQRLPITNCSPAEALKALRCELSNDEDKLLWVAKARMEAVLGSCPRSLKSVLSGIRAWMAFAGGILGREGNEFPPTLDGLLAWSLIFRSPQTFANYLGYARQVCALRARVMHSSPPLLAEWAARWLDSPVPSSIVQRSSVRRWP